jgi:imidazolonepropionase-like amidohydrolase
MAAYETRARLPRTPVAPGVTTFRGATLLDGESGVPLPDADVVVRDGIVRYAGPRRAGDDADRGRVVDLTGMWLMPGFVDVHVHLAMVPAAAEEQRAWFPEQSVLAVAAELRTTLEAGVTTVRDLDGLTPGYRLAVEQGTATGPRLHLAIAMLSPTGGHADPVLPNGTLPAWAVRLGMPEPGVVDTDEDVIRTVRRLVRMGADAIKVSTSGGTGSPTDEPEDAGVAQEQVRLIRRLVDERGGRPITAHALTDAAARGAVLGGADSIEHGYDLSDATIDLMLERGTVLVPTMSTLMRDIGPGVSSERRSAREALRSRGMDSVRRAVAAGVPVALGTDAGMVAHGSNLRELAWLVEAGLSPAEAVRAGTMAGARLLGLDDRIGSIAVGKVADLVVANVDPLTSIGDLADAGSIRMVVQSGRIVTDRDRRAG